MQALAARTKIKKEWGIASTTEGWETSSNAVHKGIFLATIDDNAYDLVSGSTRFVAQVYLPTPSSKAKEFLKKLYNYKNLPANWDNDGAIPPGEDLIDKVASFIQTLDEFDLPLYFIAPGPNGEIAIEYRYSDKSAEVFFNEDGSEEMILYTGSSQILSDLLNIQKLIQHLS